MKDTEKLIERLHKEHGKGPGGAELGAKDVLGDYMRELIADETYAPKLTACEAVKRALDEGLIKVDFDTGMVYRHYIVKDGRVERITRKIRLGTHYNGHLVCTVIYGGQKYRIRVSSIVWIAAHGVPPKDLFITHITADHMDNRLDNLRLMSLPDYRASFLGRSMQDAEYRKLLIYEDFYKRIPKAQMTARYGSSDFCEIAKAIKSILENGGGYADCI